MQETVNTIKEDMKINEVSAHMKNPVLSLEKGVSLNTYIKYGVQKKRLYSM